MLRLRPVALVLSMISIVCGAAGQEQAPAAAASGAGDAAGARQEQAASAPPVTSSAAAADGRVDSLKQEASRRFRRGAELFQEGAFRAALIEFERANELVPDFRVLYNIAQTYWQLQDYLGAAQSYERYLAAGGSQVSSDRRNEVETALSALRERVGRLAIRVEGAGAEVFVDDQRVGVAPLSTTITVNIGRHRAFARALDGRRVERVVDVPGGETAEIALVVAPSRAVPASSLEVRALSTRSGRSIAATSIAAASLLASAIVTGSMAAVRADRADEELRAKPPEGEADPERVRALQGQSRRFARATDVLLGTGIVLGATSLTLWGRKAHRARSHAKTQVRTLTWSAGMGSLRVCGRF